MKTFGKTLVTSTVYFAVTATAVDLEFAIPRGARLLALDINVGQVGAATGATFLYVTSAQASGAFDANPSDTRYGAAVTEVDLANGGAVSKFITLPLPSPPLDRLFLHVTSGGAACTSNGYVVAYLATE